MIPALNWKDCRGTQCSTAPALTVCVLHIIMPLQICALLAHLLFLRANDGTEYATALSDTFGTESFIAAALVTQVPDEFIQDVQELYPNDRQIQSGDIAVSDCYPGLMLGLLCLVLSLLCSVLCALC